MKPLRTLNRALARRNSTRARGRTVAAAASELNRAHDEKLEKLCLVFALAYSLPALEQRRERRGVTRMPESRYPWTLCFHDMQRCQCPLHRITQQMPPQGQGRP